MLLDDLLDTLQDSHHRRKGSTHALSVSCVAIPGTTLIAATKSQCTQILRDYGKLLNFSVCSLTELHRLRSRDAALVVDNHAIATVLEEARETIEKLNEEIKRLKEQIEFLEDASAGEDL